MSQHTVSEEKRLSKKTQVSFKSIEYFDYMKLKTIIDNWNNPCIPDEIKESYKLGTKLIYPKVAIHNYIMKAKMIDGNIASVAVKYHYSKNKNSGRQFASKGLGLQLFSRWIRHTITNDLYNDIDMKNAQPTILLQYCKKHKYPCKYLELSVNNNEKYLQDIMTVYKVDRHTAKQMKHRVMYGSDETINVVWFENFKKEMIQIHKLLMTDVNNEDIIKMIKKEKNTDYNLNGRVCSHILCEIENKMLCACIEFLKSEKISIKNIVLAFDGFMIRKEIFNPTEEILTRMSNYVHDKTGYTAIYINKPQDQIIGLKGLTTKIHKSIIIEDDAEACEYLLEKMSGRIISCNGIIFVKTLDTKIWTNKEYDVSREIHNACVELGLLRSTKNGNVPYSRNEVHIRNITQAIKMSCQKNDTFVETLRVKSLHKIFFKDCIYDFNLGKYRKESDDDMTPIRISRNHPINVNPEKLKKVIDVINSICEKNNKIFNCLSLTSKNLIQHFARALAGHLEDKDWVTGIGLPVLV